MTEFNFNDVNKYNDAGRSLPRQGDHVFGNLNSIFNDALKDRFGGKQNWPKTMLEEKGGVLLSRWSSSKDIDLGHHFSQENPKSYRAGMPEEDRHAHVFGLKSNKLKNIMAEILDKGSTKRRVRRLNKAFDDIFEHAVDRDALEQYLSKDKSIRGSKSKVLHEPISLKKASQIASASPSLKKNNINNIINNFYNYKDSINDIIRIHFY